MKAKSNALPASRVSVDTKGDKTTVSLWDGTYTENIRETEDGTEIEYEYSLYQINVPLRPNLAEAVERSFDKWYSAAKTAEEERLRAAEAAKLEKEISQNLPEMMLEMDFRLMMLEEMGALM